MFILYAVLVGLIVGFVAGGRLTALGELRIRWAPLILVGLLTQVVLFSDAVAERIGSLGPPLYVASTLLAVAAILRNITIPGFPLVAVGAASNMAAIVANGGFMPASPAALAALGKDTPTIYSNSSVVPNPALEPLTDVFALPAWLPFANIFSIGDVILGVGIAMCLVVVMRRVSSAAAAPPPSGASPH